MPESSRRTMSKRSSALRCPCWRRNRLRMRSRLLERLPPAGRRLAMSGRGRSMVARVGSGSSRTSIGGERLSAAAGGRRVRILDGEAAAGDGIDEVDLGTLEIPDADRIDVELHAVRFVDLIARALTVFFDHQPVLKA